MEQENQLLDPYIWSLALVHEKGNNKLKLDLPFQPLPRIMQRAAPEGEELVSQELTFCSSNLSKLF